LKKLKNKLKKPAKLAVSQLYKTRLSELKPKNAHIAEMFKDIISNDEDIIDEEQI
jgi:uncharacterized protein YdcH (DUF465 family)